MMMTMLAGTQLSAVMPGLVPGIHAFLFRFKQDVDGRDKPGHDDLESFAP
jgi:hypothetical protein